MYKEAGIIVENGTKRTLYVPTTEEAIKDFKDQLKGSSVKVGTMRYEGKIVPAFIFETEDNEASREYLREEWKQEASLKQDQRCTICGEGGKSKKCPLRVKNPNYSGKPGEKKTIAVKCDKCPFYRLFHPVKGMVLFSELEVMDTEGESDEFDPDGTGYYSGDAYMMILSDLLEYVKDNCTDHPEYSEFVSLLGSEIGMRETADTLDKSVKTLYGWRDKLRPIIKEFLDSVDYM